MNVKKDEHQIGTRLRSTGWVIDARWYYMWLAFILVFVTKKPEEFPYMAIALFILVIGVLAANAYFHWFVRHRDFATLPARKVSLFNTAQIALDLVFFFVVMLFTGGGVESVGHSFFFIPIIVSMILFGFRGSITVAIISGFLVLFSVVLHAGFFPLLLTFGPGSLSLDKELSLALTEAGIIFLVYILIGFFCGYISRLLHARDLMLNDQLAKEAGHVARLEELTTEFDKSAKLLVRRDIELSNVNEKLQQLDKMKSEIISVVAHQLRTPLSAIKWTLKILLDGDTGKPTPAQAELLQKGFDSNERMITLINDMLEVDRLESGKLKYNFVLVQFEELVRTMMKELLPLATQRNIRMELSTPPSPLVKIKVDEDKMRDVLQNLMDNAIKYTKEGGTVGVGVQMEGEELHFWVRDNGIGVPEEEKIKIFSRFFRAINAVRTETDGSGLGLFIAQSIVKRHGGKIWFESTLGVGSTFHVLLPFLQ